MSGAQSAIFSGVLPWRMVWWSDLGKTRLDHTIQVPRIFEPLNTANRRDAGRLFFKKNHSLVSNSGTYVIGILSCSTFERATWTLFAPLPMANEFVIVPFCGSPRSV